MANCILCLVALTGLAIAVQAHADVTAPDVEVSSGADTIYNDMPACRSTPALSHAAKPCTAAMVSSAAP